MHWLRLAHSGVFGRAEAPDKKCVWGGGGGAVVNVGRKRIETAFPHKKLSGNGVPTREILRYLFIIAIKLPCYSIPQARVHGGGGARDPKSFFFFFFAF